MAESGQVKSRAVRVRATQKERYEAPKTNVRPKRQRPGRDTEGGLTEAQRRTVLAEEERIKDNTFETAVIVNTRGEVVGRARGNGFSVTGRDMVNAVGGDPRNFKDTVLIHNHPGNEQRKAFGDTLATRIGSPLSPADLSYAAAANMAEVRAVTPNYIYSVRRPAGGWPNATTTKAIRNATNRAGRARAYMLYDFVNEWGNETLGRQRRSRAELLAQWDSIQAMAKAMGTTITRRKR